MERGAGSGEQGAGSGEQGATKDSLPPCSLLPAFISLPGLRPQTIIERGLLWSRARRAMPS